MKGFLVLVMLISALIPAFGADSSNRDVIYDDDLDITFTSLIEYNIGFSREPISGTIKPEDDGFDAADHNNGELRIRFLPDATTGGYTTGEFNFYAQVFTTTPMRFYITEATSLTNEDGTSVDYTNTSFETSSVFTGSGSTGGEIIRESGTADDLRKPRTYNREMCLVVTGEDNINKIINASGDLTASITVKVEAV